MIPGTMPEFYAPEEDGWDWFWGWPWPGLLGAIWALGPSLSAKFEAFLLRPITSVCSCCLFSSSCILKDAWIYCYNSLSSLSLRLSLAPPSSSESSEFSRPMKASPLVRSLSRALSKLLPFYLRAALHWDLVKPISIIVVTRPGSALGFLALATTTLC